MPPLPPSAYAHLIEQALAEDIGRGDRTTLTLFPEPVPAIARVIGREEMVAAGLWLVPEIFERLDPKVRTEIRVPEGQRVPPKTVLAQLTGDGRSLLTGERVTLNFLQRLCGIATLTARFVQAVQGSKTLLLDTRKTTPGWRLLEKYAVRMGGGRNHRMALDEGLLIKDNHLSLIGSVHEALRRARETPASEPIELEVQNTEQVREALKSIADDPEPSRKYILMLDNMTAIQIQEALSIIQGRVRVEVSGGVALSNVREIAYLGADFISIGALTHSAPAADIGMEIGLTP